MPARHLDKVHGHRSWDQQVKQEHSEDGRLHRHRVVSFGGAVLYTSWDHNAKSHHHRLPNGAWTRPRYDLNPPEPAVPNAERGTRNAESRATGGSTPAAVAPSRIAEGKHLSPS
jgi:hypothetical protein